MKLSCLSFALVSVLFTLLFGSNPTSLQAQNCGFGGQITSLQDTVCLNGTTQLFLNGFDGTIVRWEYSSREENWYSWFTILNTSRSITTPPVGSETRFRAVIRKDNCAEVFSNVVYVNLKEQGTMKINYVPESYVNSICPNVSYAWLSNEIGLYKCPYGKYETEPWGNYYINKCRRWQENDDRLGDFIPITKIEARTEGWPWKEIYRIKCLSNNDPYMNWYIQSRFSSNYDFEQDRRDDIRYWYNDDCGANKYTVYGYYTSNEPKKAEDYFETSRDTICMDEVFTIRLKKSPIDIDNQPYGYYVTSLNGFNLLRKVSPDLKKTSLITFEDSLNVYLQDQPYLKTLEFNQILMYEYNFKSNPLFINNNRNYLITSAQSTETEFKIGPGTGTEWDPVLFSEQALENYRRKYGQDFTAVFYATSQQASYYESALSRSPRIRIPVSLPTDGGAVGANAFICPNNRPGPLKLYNHRGTILKWQVSVDNGRNWTDIVHTDSIYTPGALSQTTWYRAWVQHRTCSAKPSTPAVITVVPETEAGTLVADTMYCTSDVPPVISIKMLKGQVLNWESSEDGTTWTTINHVASNYRPRKLERNSWFRVKTQAFGCNVKYTPVIKINVIPIDLPNDIQPKAEKDSICSNEMFAQLNIDLPAGQIIEWQVNECCLEKEIWQKIYLSENQTGIRHSVYIPYPDTIKKYWFRVKYRPNPLCDEIFSKPICVTVLLCTGGQCSGSVKDGLDSLCEGERITLFVCKTPGRIVRWESRPFQPQSTWSPINVASREFTSDPLYEKTCFRAVSEIMGREYYSNEVCVTTITKAKPGTVKPNRSVCKGENSGDLTLEGHMGKPLYWEYSYDSVSWYKLRASEEKLKLRSEALFQKTWFRAVFKDCGGVCVLAFSQASRIDVMNYTASYGGTASAFPKSICTNQTAKIDLTGYTGQVVYWQETDPEDEEFKSARKINSTEIFLITPPLTKSKRYRAVVKNSSCQEAFSKSVIVEMNGVIKAGKITGELSVCIGQPANIKLTESNATPVAWEYSQDLGVTWVKVLSSATDFQTIPVITPIQVRVLVGDTSCSTDYTPVTLIGLRNSKAGTVTGNNAVCLGSTTTLQLSGTNETVLKWEYSEDDGNNWLVLPDNSTTINTPTINKSTLFRAFVRESTCEPSYTDSYRINISEKANAVLTANTANVCKGGSINLTVNNLNGGTIERWENSDDGFNWILLPETGSNLTIKDIKNNTYFRAWVNQNACPTLPTNTVSVSVYEQTAPYISGSNKVCKGQTLNLNVNYYSGNILRWEYSVNGGINWSWLGVTANTYVTAPIISETRFRVVCSQSESCPAIYSNPLIVTPLDIPEGGTVTGGGIGCVTQDENGTLTSFQTSLEVSGYKGKLLRWEESKNEGQTWIPCTVNYGYSDKFTYSTTTNARVRAVIQPDDQNSVSCEPVYSSNFAEIKVNFTSAPKLKSSAYEVCVRSSEPITIEVLTEAIDVISWEKRNYPNCLNDWHYYGTETITASGATLDVTNLTQSTCFRATVKSKCGSNTITSELIEIKVTDQPEIKSLTPSQSIICEGEPLSITARGVKGNILRWEQSADQMRWLPIRYTDNVIELYPTEGTVFYRAVAGIVGCIEVISAEVKITVRPKTSGGKLISSTKEATVCTDEPVTLQVDQMTHPILWWEVSTNDFATVYRINETSSQLIAPILGSTVSYRVVSIGCNDYQNAYSNVVTIEYKSCNNCSRPQIYSTQDSTGKITFSWYVNREGEQYEFSYRKNKNSEWITSAITGTRGATLSKLQPCQLYEARLRTLCKGAFTSYSDTIIFTGLAAPRKLVVEEITKTSSIVRWNSIQALNISYQVLYREQYNYSASWTESPILSGRMTFYALESLKPNTTYEVRLRARCSACSDWKYYSETTTRFKTVLPAVPCSQNKTPPPPYIQLDPMEANKAMLRWANIADAFGVNIKYGVNEEARTGWKDIFVCSPQDSLLLDNLKAGKTYELRIRTLCNQCQDMAIGNKVSGWSPLLTFSIPNKKVENEQPKKAPQLMSIYPNPNNGTFHILLSEDELKEVSVYLYDVNGKMVAHHYFEALSEPNLKVSYPNISSGVYSILVKTTQQNSVVRLVIE